LRYRWWRKRSKVFTTTDNPKLVTTIPVRTNYLTECGLLVIAPDVAPQRKWYWHLPITYMTDKVIATYSWWSKSSQALTYISNTSSSKEMDLPTLEPLGKSGEVVHLVMGPPSQLQSLNYCKLC